ncbi:MAG: GNAT family N-acetyltransferase [Sphingobacteriia bacterium]|nr:MAG: GNAT family N-acetyltransferase [Sphingobacteriia bacterium]
MIVETKNNQQVLLRKLHSNDLDNLLSYLENLSMETKKRFGPHQFDKQSVIDFYDNPAIHLGYVAQSIDSNDIIAYSIIKIGYLESDYNRYLSYGIQLDNKIDCEFAPSVADSWQSFGIGNKLFYYILADLKKAGVKRIVLWGGVQADNEKAVNYYKKNNFVPVGQFWHNGENVDMLLNI